MTHLASPPAVAESAATSWRADEDRIGVLPESIRIYGVPAAEQVRAR
jgi:hypothetical protein